MQRSLTERLRAIGLLALAIIAAAIWLGVISQPDGKLHAAFLDVGEGDAVLITTPTGQHLLVDGGPAPDLLMSALGREMPFWKRSLDAVIMTHPHEDHLTGLIEVLDRYDAGMVLAPETTSDGPAFREWRGKLQAMPDDKVQVLSRGDAIDLGSGVEITVLNPPGNLFNGTESDLNNNSLVLKVSYGKVSILFTGDIQTEAQQSMLATPQGIRSVILKVPHQGAKGLSEEFLEAVAPQTAVISVSAENRFGHPAPETLSLLSGVQLLRTDKNGTIRIASDGEVYWVTSDR